jgi:hypothetical protein
MLTNVRGVTLATPQEACLSAFRLGKVSVTQVAITGRLSVKNVFRALLLARIRKTWHTTKSRGSVAVTDLRNMSIHDLHR